MGLTPPARHSFQGHREAMFGMDAQVPGMHYAAIRQALVFGAKVKSFDAAELRRNRVSPMWLI